LLAAQRAYEVEDWETCVSRAYYAVYHAVIYLLEVRANLHRRRWDHDQIQADFRSRFASRGFLFSRQDTIGFNKLREDRLKADYDPNSNRQSAVRSLQTSRSLLARITEVTRDA
jgi:uncharacterized protein (UPF0332 family)